MAQATAQTGEVMRVFRAVVAASPGDRVSLRRLIGGLAAAPLDVVALIRLARRYRVATRSLASLVLTDLPGPFAAGARVV